MERRELEAGDVVQIAPDQEPIFGGCLMVVTDPKSWGAQGYVALPGKGLAFYRVGWHGMEYVGRATWTTEVGDG